MILPVLNVLNNLFISAFCFKPSISSTFEIFWIGVLPNVNFGANPFCTYITLPIMSFRSRLLRSICAEDRSAKNRAEKMNNKASFLLIHSLLLPNLSFQSKLLRPLHSRTKHCLFRTEQHNY